MATMDHVMGWVRGKLRTVYSGHKTIYIMAWVVVIGVILVAIFANLVSPHSPYAQSLPNRLLPPAWVDGGNTAYLLGTDKLGRDILSRLIYGARVSLIVAAVALIPAAFVGVALGLPSGYFGRRLDSLIMRTCDAALAFPPIVIALPLAVALGPSFFNLVAVLVAVLWARYARLVRGEVLAWKQRDFISYARAVGTSPFRIMTRHLFPNILNSLVVLMALQAGYVIIMEASLSFLGIGVPPQIPTWGSMTADGAALLNSAWWVSLFPGLAIVITCLALNLIGDWLREVLDPKQRQV